MKGVPGYKEWLPLGPKSTMDEGYAYRHFFGKTAEQATGLFAQNALYYQEDLLYMPQKPFSYYLEAFIAYLRSPESDGDSDGASCFLGLIEFKVEHEWKDIKDTFKLLVEHVDYVADNQQKYDAQTCIYGSFQKRRKRIYHKAAQLQDEK